MAIEDPSAAAELARATALHLVCDGYAVIEKGLRADAVGASMALSRTGVHSRLRMLGHPASNEGLLRNLVDVWLDPNRTGATERLAEQMLRAVDEGHGSEPVETIKLLCAAFFDEVQNSNIVEAQLALWMGRSDPAVRSGMEGLYGHIDAIVADLVDALLLQWNRSMRPPLTTHDLATIMGALVEGLLIRQRVRSEPIPTELFGTLVLAVLPTITVHKKEKPGNLETLVARHTRRYQSPELLSANEMRARIIEMVTGHLRSGAPATKLTSARVAVEIDVDVDLHRDNHQEKNRPGRHPDRRAVRDRDALPGHGTRTHLEDRDRDSGQLEQPSLELERLRSRRVRIRQDPQQQGRRVQLQTRL